MTDLVFLLLIFFIILSTLVVDLPEHKIEYPSMTDDPQPKPKKEITIVSINAENEFFVGKSKKAITSDQLETAIMSSVAKTKDSVVEIHGDKASALESSFEIINIAKANQLKIVFKGKK